MHSIEASGRDGLLGEEKTRLGDCSSSSWVREPAVGRVERGLVLAGCEGEARVETSLVLMGCEGEARIGDAGRVEERDSGGCAAGRVEGG